MRAEKLDYFLEKSEKICFVSKCLPYLPFAAAIDLTYASFARADEALYHTFDAIIFHDKPVTFYKNWQAIVLEMINLGQEKRFILCIKTTNSSVGKSRDVYDLIRTSSKYVSILDEYTDKRSGFHVAFYEIEKLTHVPEALRKNLKNTACGSVSVLEMVFLKMYHKFFKKR